MKSHRTHLFLLLTLFLLPGATAFAQEQRQEFGLPAARPEEDYRIEIEAVLRDKYRLKLESGNANAIILWTMASGELPAGLFVRTDGTIIGRPADARIGLYQFSLKAVDMSARDEPLELRFSLEMKSVRLRLTK